MDDSRTAPPSVLELTGVELRRGGQKLLNDVSFRIEKGQHWALLGPNGAGKTLILRLATGYIWPTEGQIVVLGHLLGRVDLRLLRRRIGWVSQALADLNPGHATLLETILSGPLASLGLYEDPDEAMVVAAQKTAQDFGLAKILDRPFGLLSTGERQRTLLARAALANPELLILDEPVSNLDLGARERFLSEVARLATDPLGPTVVLTTHSLQEIGPFVSHVILLKNGEILAMGPINEVLTSANLTKVYDLPLKIEKTRAGRFMAFLE
ncbi:MAG: ATP-binding cassette domain-containing protein [Deltaproteobacteria bacterium]|jgi:iron complex transport system ATP-binding protein|nr:ATP-binding cassette domain-containing protein [Deltaproteobacteria bacterium]